MRRHALPSWRQVARLLAVALLGACAAPRAAPAPRPTGVLLVRCDVGDAALWIDDRPAGDVGRLPGGVRLGAGAHRIELRHDGYHTRYAEVELAAGERKVVTLTLPEALP